MSGPPVLSHGQLEQFERDGFLIVRRLFTAAEIADQSGWIDEVAALRPAIGRQMVYFEDSLVDAGRRVLSRIEKFVEVHSSLGALVTSATLIDRVSDLFGDAAVLFKEKINFKMPGGGGFTPHQDIQAGWDTYAPYFISVLIAVDANTIANGCLELAAGQHRRGLIGRTWEPLAGDELSGLDFVPYPMESGDAALFDCFAPHQSQPNLTAHRRRNMYLTYNRKRDGDHRERYFADKRRSYPPDYERDPDATYVFRV